MTKNEHFPEKHRMATLPGQRDVRVDDKEWNEMEQNGTELKVSQPLATPDEAKRGQRDLMLAHRVRVNGGPNEATVASFPASPLGVNEANQGQMGPGFTPPPFPTKAVRSLLP